MNAHEASSSGTFEFIEAKIRRDAEGTSFGGDFEWLCRWFLENAPRYRGQFEKIWLWKDWPEKFGPDAGIDLVARTRDGELWAIQAKADHPDRAITKREIDSFLSESNRPEFVYRLLMATTDDIGANARRTIHAQQKPVGLVLRGHLLTEEVEWPTTIGGGSKPLQRWKPRPHQATAIEAVVNGFRAQDRGQLVMACGTGKTLTALWIAQRLQSSLTLVLVPSLSLVQQNLSEWGRHAAQDFDTLVVCSDESVTQKSFDAAVQSTADLGVKVTTDSAEIHEFLAQRRKRPAVVFATYQSSDRIAAAQTGKTMPFDLVICDEAHRLAGHAESLFATVLDAKKIRARRRLFMTATPRYFKDHVKRRAAELEYELVSMDDQHVFGPEFHVLTFHEAITAEPPLLTDYQVVVIGVTDRDAKAWAERATLVRTASGLTTDARTLAAQIGLAKAMRKYDLRRLITFHSSVAKAARFVDATQPDSLPGVIPHLSSFVVPPSGGKKRRPPPEGGTTNWTLWAKHISGHTPAGQRATLLNGLGHLPSGTRGIISNCACLGEGVDVPVLDGVAFIDPKRSMVDIIQAVGRVIRKAEGKQLGTIVIPVFLDETEDPDTALSQSAFEPVWQVLKALRAHDRRLADELDQLRLELGKRSKSRGRIKLPANIHLDVPQLLRSDFEQAFYVRTVEATTDRQALTIEQILTWADEYKARNGKWPMVQSGLIDGTDTTWCGVQVALQRGLRGLPGGTSLAQLLREHRGKRYAQGLPPLTVAQILQWIDDHKTITGNWPTTTSGTISSTGDVWRSVNSALLLGQRGLPGGSSIARLLAEHRGVRNSKDLPPFTIAEILSWADEHKARTGVWPTKNSGPIPGTHENWRVVIGALSRGVRGLAKGNTLARLLSDHRGKTHPNELPRLTVEQILELADSHKRATGRWPSVTSGPISGQNLTWLAVNLSLRDGYRGLTGGTSLAKLLAKHRGVRHATEKPTFSVTQILSWADAHKTATGHWPNSNSGQVAGTEETWLKIDAALKGATRGLPGDSSLAKLLAQYRSKRNPKDLPELTIDQILVWSDRHQAETGQLPTMKSGQVIGTDETWERINSALMRGARGLPENSSLAKVLSQHRGKKYTKELPNLTIGQILAWADAHKLATDWWPTANSGQVLGIKETWSGLQNALSQGGRGLPGNSSLGKLLAKYRSVRNRGDLPDLTIEQILAWADTHKAATGQWPTLNAGKIAGTEESWSGIQSALRRGGRGLPYSSTLAKLLRRHRSH